jgi:hypothetical protein
MAVPPLTATAKASDDGKQYRDSLTQLRHLLTYTLRLVLPLAARLAPGWLAFTVRTSNPLDHCERFQITWSSSS